MNHQELIERSHKQARDKGFWEKPLTFDMAMALIISEIAEALEAYRKGRVNPDWNDSQAVKDSFEVEIADAIIRVYDWCGGNDFIPEVEDKEMYWLKDDEGYNFMRLFEDCTIYHRQYRESGIINLESLLESFLSYTEFHNIDIEKYIMWKLDYNLNREYLHGKKF